jgi:Ni/Co efflux regulator RcnB
MKKILLAIGISSGLMLTPVVALADDAAAPKTEMKMEKPKHHHHHHNYHRKATKHKKRSPHIERHMDKPAAAPK